jgi:dihydroneopterin aldolase
MHETLQDCPDDLVFNLDEVGISDWEDQKPKRVVVAITASAQCSALATFTIEYVGT